MARKKTKKGAAALPVSLDDARTRAAEVLSGARKRVDSLLPAAQRKEIARLEARVARFQKDVTRARERAQSRAEGLARGLWTGVEKRAVAVVRPIVSRLNLASRGDVERLRRRIGDLERRFHETARTSTAA